jgi:hypothetical protein
MNKSYFSIYILTFLVGIQISGHKKIKILLVGNSLFSRNNLKENLNMLSKNNGKKVEIDIFTIDGAPITQSLGTLLNHSQTTQTVPNLEPAFEFWKPESFQYKNFKNMIRKYDIIILQPSGIKEKNFSDIVTEICMVKQKKGRILVFQCFSEVLWNSEIRHNNLQDGIDYFKNNFPSCSELLPVGILFHNVYTLHRDYDLQTEDLHPTELGTFSMSMVIYNSIFKENPLANSQWKKNMTLNSLDIEKALVISKYLPNE